MSASLIGHLGSSAFRLSTNSSVDVAHGLSLLFGLGTKGPSIMGFEDEVEQSFGRPCRQCDGRFKRTYELTSFIVPRCLAIFTAQALSQDHFVERTSMLWAAS